MPLPHFLLMLIAAIAAAGLTIWAAFSAGIPAIVLGLIALIAALLTHFAGKPGGDTPRRRATDGHYNLPDGK